MSNSRIIIIGAGGFGHEVAEYICDIRKLDLEKEGVIGFLDSSKKAKSENKSWPILGDIEDFDPEPEDKFLIGLGNPEERAEAAKKLNKRKLNFTKLIHPTAYISRTAKISDGCIVSPFSIVGYRAKLSPHVLLNTYAAVGHHSKIGSYSVLSPKVLIAGNSEIKEKVFFGTGAIVTPRTKVEEGASVSASSVVYRNVKAKTTVIGNPAKNKW